MKTPIRTNETRTVVIGGHEFLEMPNKSLVFSGLRLNFPDRISQKGNQSRQRMLELIIGENLEQYGSRTELLKEYAADASSISKKWFENNGWSVREESKPEEREESWLLGNSATDTLELVNPVRWLDIWEGLIFKGFTPSILRTGHLLGFPATPPGAGNGKVLINQTTKGGWDYVWQDPLEAGGKTRAKSLTLRKWGGEREMPELTHLFEKGWEDEPVFSAIAPYQVQEHVEGKGWLSDQGFYTLKAATDHAKKYMEVSRIINVTSGKEVFSFPSEIS